MGNDISFYENQYMYKTVRKLEMRVKLNKMRDFYYERSERLK